MRNDQHSSRKRHLYGFSALAALALLLIAMTVNAIHAGRSRDRAEGWQFHTLQVLLVAGQLRSSVNEALRGERGYLITGDPQFLDAYQDGSRSAEKLANELRELTQDNPTQRGSIAALEPQLKRSRALLERVVTMMRDGKAQEAIEVVKSGAGRREATALLDIITRIENEERRLLTERAAENSRAAWYSELANYALAVLALVFLLIVGWAGYTASRARMSALEMAEQLRTAANTDELTGLLNRRAFMIELEKEIRRSHRSGTPLSVALVDLDHFKSVNDRFGHGGGDEVLRKFAETAQATMRSSDVIGRLGGEEFAVLMPDTDQIQSGMASERLRDAIARRRVVLSTGGLVPTTVSIGVAHLTANEDSETLVGRADEALYDAKASGRNRTRCAA